MRFFAQLCTDFKCSKFPGSSLKIVGLSFAPSVAFYEIESSNKGGLVSEKARQKSPDHNRLYLWLNSHTGNASGSMNDPIAHAYKSHGLDEQSVQDFFRLLSCDREGF